ncbi:MAG: leucine-rich repeat domain-containing protein, partial [Lachnospiraceae bacterium]|nr:leucine-rich repeat domain-containing protein [Lachnospiraceae bacterium]
MKRKFFKCAMAFVLAVLMGAQPVMSYAMTASDGGTVSSESGSAGSGTDAADTEDTQEEMMGSVLQDLESSLQEQREQILSDLGMTEEEFETYEPEGYFESGDPSVSEASGILPVGVQDIEYTDEQTGFTCRELNGSYAEIIGYSGTAAELFIPGTLGVYTIQAIGDNAFQNNTSLTSVTMASSITSIGSYAFEGCTSLQAVTFSENLAEIGEGAFSGCTALSNTNISELTDLTSIDSYLFAGCTSFTSIELPDSLTYIGYRAFYNCTSLTVINYPMCLEEAGGGI